MYILRIISVAALILMGFINSASADWIGHAYAYYDCRSKDGRKSRCVISQIGRAATKADAEFAARKNCADNADPSGGLSPSDCKSSGAWDFGCVYHGIDKKNKPNVIGIGHTRELASQRCNGCKVDGVCTSQPYRSVDDANEGVDRGPVQ